MLNYILIFLIAVGIALIFTPITVKIAYKYGVIDIPADGRRVHKKPIPRLGGVAIYFGTTISIILMLPLSKELIGILIGGALISLTGVLDDIYRLSAKVKLACQIVCAVVLYYFEIRISFIGLPFGDEYLYFAWPISLLVTIIWIVGITNTINLIDGLDGLAAGVAAIASFSLAYIAYINHRPETAMLTLAIAGGAIGFLPFNFNPAKIFMGDGGALFLGFMLAAVSIVGPMKGVTAIATVIPVLALGLPIFDTAFAIYRRIIQGKPIMEADKGHLHHRILSQGMNQKKTVVILYVISGILGVAAILINKNMFLDGTVLIILTSALVIVFTKQEEKMNEEHKIYKKN